MNAFYGLKALTRNEPISFEETDDYPLMPKATGKSAVLVQTH
jgi:hypothetical protein